jgi:hypothetical protein
MAVVKGKKKQVIMKKKQTSVRVNTQGELMPSVKPDAPELCPHCGVKQKTKHRLGIVYECGVLFPTK